MTEIEGLAALADQYTSAIRQELEIIDLLATGLAKTDVETAKKIANRIYKLKILLNVPT